MKPEDCWCPNCGKDHGDYTELQEEVERLRGILGAIVADAEEVDWTGGEVAGLLVGRPLWEALSEFIGDDVYTPPDPQPLTEVLKDYEP